MDIIDTTKFLIVQLLLFDNEQQKLRDMCTPLQNLEVNVCDVQQIYQLQCIIEHQGTGIISGHYVSYFKTNDMWYHASDQHVSRISTKDLPK